MGWVQGFLWLSGVRRVMCSERGEAHERGQRGERVLAASVRRGEKGERGVRIGRD